MKMPCIRCYGIVVKKKKKKHWNTELYEEKVIFGQIIRKLPFPASLVGPMAMFLETYDLLKTVFFMVHKRSLL